MRMINGKTNYNSELISPKLSFKIKIVTTINIILVVYLHAYNIGIGYLQNDTIILEKIRWNSFIQLFLSNGVAISAVPLLYIISGYLFFHNFKPDRYKNKLVRRINTLLIPYILWCTIGVMFLFVCQENAFMSDVLSKAHFISNILKPVQRYNIIDWFSRYVTEPVPFQLWYIEDLIVLIILSPIIYFLIEKTPFLFLVSLCLLWLTNLNTLRHHVDAIFFFSIGAFCSLKQVSECNPFFERNKYLLISLWLIVITTKTLCSYYTLVPFIHIRSAILLPALNDICVFLGIFSIWSIGGANNSATSCELLNFSYFIFFLHEPLQKIFTYTIFNLSGRSSTTSLIVYLAEPIILIFICILVATAIKRYFPKFYYILTGGR